MSCRLRSLKSGFLKLYERRQVWSWLSREWRHIEPCTFCFVLYFSAYVFLPVMSGHVFMTFHDQCSLSCCCFSLTFLVRSVYRQRISEVNSRLPTPKQWRFRKADTLLLYIKRWREKCTSVKGKPLQLRSPVYLNSQEYSVFINVQKLNIPLLLIFSYNE